MCLKSFPDFLFFSYSTNLIFKYKGDEDWYLGVLPCKDSDDLRRDPIRLDSSSRRFQRIMTCSPKHR
jgi:hypothetical protein